MVRCCKYGDSCYRPRCYFEHKDAIGRAKWLSLYWAGCVDTGSDDHELQIAAELSKMQIDFDKKLSHENCDKSSIKPPDVVSETCGSDAQELGNVSTRLQDFGAQVSSQLLNMQSDFDAKLSNMQNDFDTKLSHVNLGESQTEAQLSNMQSDFDKKLSNDDELKSTCGDKFLDFEAQITAQLSTMQSNIDKKVEERFNIKSNDMKNIFVALMEEHVRPLLGRSVAQEDFEKHFEKSISDVRAHMGMILDIVKNHGGRISSIEGIVGENGWTAIGLWLAVYIKVL